MKHLIFVYGTLMKGHCNDHYLREEKYIGIGKLRDYGMYHVDTYPGIVESHGEVVVGELYEVHEKVLHKLDQLELEGDLYLRKTLDVILDCQTLKANVYVYNQPITVNMQKVTEMPWEPSQKEPCRLFYNQLKSDSPFTEAMWPIVVQKADGSYYETCTIRGAMAVLMGDGYLENNRSEDDWQQRVKYAMREIMAKHEHSHVIIHDQVKGVIAENCVFEEAAVAGEATKENEFVHVESERGFLFSLARLDSIRIFEREDERYFSNWKDDGNDPTVAKRVKGKRYVNIADYDLEALIQKTWQEL